MFEFLDSLALLGPLVDLGITGVLMIMVWRLMIKKDKKSYDMLDAMNQERKEIYESHTEMVREVTSALSDKNHTDEVMSRALEKLTEELKRRREK